MTYTFFGSVIPRNNKPKPMMGIETKITIIRAGSENRAFPRTKRANIITQNNKTTNPTFRKSLRILHHYRNVLCKLYGLWKLLIEKASMLRRKK